LGVVAFLSFFTLHTFEKCECSTEELSQDEIQDYKEKDKTLVAYH
jgi:hypothetical protein